MAFCTKCGGEVPENNQFCGKCGASRVPAERPATPAKKRAPRWLVWTVLVLAGFAILLALLPDDSKNPTSAASSTAAPAAAPALTPADREYFSKVQAIIQPVSKSMTDFSELAAVPRLQDDSWKTQLIINLAIWQAGYAEAQKLAPPARWMDLNQRFLQSLSDLNDAAHDVASALDNNDPAQMRLAVNEIKQADAIAQGCSRDLRVAAGINLPQP